MLLLLEDVINRLYTRSNLIDKIIKSLNGEIRQVSSWSWRCSLLVDKLHIACSTWFAYEMSGIHENPI